MDIACVIHSLDGGGAERVMAGLATRLAQRGHRVTLVTLDDGATDRHSVEGVVRRPLDVMGESGSPIAAIMNLRRRVGVLRAAVQDIRPDVVLSFCDRTNILAVMAIAPTGIPIVISERSDPAEQTLGRFYSWQRSRMYPRADRVIAQTDAAAGYLQSILDRHSNRRRPDKVDVIASAVDAPPLVSDRTIATTNRRIVGIGRLETEKGFDRLIEAFALVHRRHPDWTLRIVGEGTKRPDLESQVRQLGLQSHVTMPGWVRPVWGELAPATVFVLPSRYEGFPSALMESMAAGVPSVSVDCPSGPGAIVNDGVNGLLVADNVDGITGGIEQMIQDPPHRESMGRTGTEVLQRFGWDAMVDAYEQVLSEASALPGRSAR
ncbi:4-alpha-N-acetylgalactosaminyltransferase [Rubripirellula tenax]|uniref:4-alpha-N-acetylgalactosaminyltransferase n=1 Tax=Rubripirellula tenax TaxID=2528015 RepID=A0A5C6FIY2_9BACT|nr:glycosyltransferase family 4 protein [Rubripirellula tenax]TWU60543.1 4-alpha-N-acetylgalactosaminyltransferase [Rubripirellula tenax]